RRIAAPRLQTPRLLRPHLPRCGPRRYAQHCRNVARADRLAALGQPLLARVGRHHVLSHRGPPERGRFEGGTAACIRETWETAPSTTPHPSAFQTSPGSRCSTRCKQTTPPTADWRARPLHPLPCPRRTDRPRRADAVAARALDNQRLRG